MNKNNKNSFVKQAMFLSVSGILVRLIGVLYGIRLTSIIGDLGNGYYSSAYTVYSIILLVCSYSIPMAVSKIMSEKRAMKQYETANRVFICALVYVVVVGGIGAIVTFIFADRMVDVAQAAVAMRVLAPTIFFSGILSVMRGFFQSRNTMVPTAVSQLIEQVFNAVISVAAAYLWSKSYSAGADEIIQAKYGAAGAAVGTCSGVVSSLLFLTVLFAMTKRKESTLEREQGKPAMSYPDVMKIIFLMVTPVILSTCIYNISTLLDMKVFYNVMGLKDIDGNTLAKLYGMYSRKYAPLSNVPIALASSMVAAVVPEISVSFAKGKIAETNEKIHSAMKFSMFLIIPASLGMAVLAEPIMDLLFPGSDVIAVHLLQFGAVSIIFYGISTVLNGVLQGIGKVNIPMQNAVIALVAHLAILIPLLYFTDMGIYGILLAVTLYSVIISGLNLRKVGQYLTYKQELKQTFVMPLMASAVMAVSAWVTYQGAYLVVHSFIGTIRIAIGVAIMAAVVVACGVYFLVLLKTGIYDKELRGMPVIKNFMK